MNQVTLIGRLGADPAVSYLPDGTPVANMRIATDESYKNQNGEKIERTEWHRVVTYSKLAEIANDYASKGRLVVVTGKLRTRPWKDQNNIDRYTTEIVANNMRLLDSKKPEEQTIENTNEQTIDDGVPF